MKQRRLSKRSSIIAVSSISLMLVIMAIGLFIAGQRLDANERSEVDSLLAPYSTAFQIELTRRIGRVSSLTAYLTTHENIDEPGGFEIFAEHIMTPDIRTNNLQFIRGTITERVYPLEGNTQMIGVDWSKTGKNKKLFEKAVSAKTSILIGPYVSRHGELVIAAVEPAYRKDESLIGMAVAVYDWSSIIKNSSISDSSKNLQLSLRTSGKQLLYGRAEVFTSNPVVKEIEVGGQTWTIAAIPKNGWAARRNAQLLPFLIAGSSVVLLLTILLLLVIDRQRRLEIAVGKRTSELIETNEELARMASFPKLDPNPVLEFDKKGNVRFANDAAKNMLVSIGVEENMSQFLPEDYGEIAAMMDSRNHPSTVSRTVKLKDRILGETVHLIGRFNVTRIYATDITERIQAEEIRKAQQEEIKRNYKIIKESLEGTVKAIATVAEHKDPYTSGHERRVVDLACAIGKELGFDVDTLEGLRIAAMLHDVGKIYIPAEILSKPGKLNEMEFRMIKEHPRYSFEILSGIDFPWLIAEMALQHHERIDGSGYPEGLKGEDIRIEAKILAVADVIEAMSSHRPYRPALPMGDALDEIKRGKGKIYDEKVAAAAIAIFKRGYKL